MVQFHIAANFSVTEAADIINVSEDTLRTWHARNPTEYMGTKIGHRVWFSPMDIYFFALVRDLTAFGVSVRVAMFNAARLADDASNLYGPIRDEALVVRVSGDVSSFHMISTAEIGEVMESSLYVPLAKIWAGVMEKARETFAKEAA